MASSTSHTATGTPAAASSSAAAGLSAGGSNLKIVGVILAVVSGLLIGSSFVFKKKGLLRSQAGQTAGEGVAYLKSPLWWTGMIMMIIGELCNFAAYAFVEALVVTPLGALSVVICAILSSIFLKETLTFFGWLGCALCIIGSVIIALNGPQEASVGQIREFEKLFLAPGFLVFGSVLIVISLVIIFYFAPKYGKTSMLWYIFVCSMIGGISVSVTTGLGASIVTTAMGQNQFNYWFIYFLIVFVIVTLVTEVYYLNVALALFNTAMVTPTYYVIFTFFSMVTTVVLFQGLKASASQIITIVMAFLVICVGITILQMSKVDPTTLSKLDRRSTILLQASRSRTEVEEKSISGVEDPGMDALRGSFGTVGSIIRARSARRMSQSSHAPSTRARRVYDAEGIPYSTDRITTGPDALKGMTRHQLYDAPMPPMSDDRLTPKSNASPSLHSSSPESVRRTTIKFDSTELVHQYPRPGAGDATATHEHRDVARGGYPPSTSTPSLPQPKADDDDSNTLRQMTSSPIQLDTDSTPHTLFRQDPRDIRTDARHVFSSDSIDSTTELMSIPSDSDSQAPWDTPPVPAKSPRFARAYPKGEDDKEESVRLFNRNQPPAESPSEEGPSGGIRLVPPSGNSKF